MGPFYDAQSRPGAWPGGLQACCQRGRSEHTDCLTKMRPSRARSSGPEASYHILYSVGCITTTAGLSFWYIQTRWHPTGPFKLVGGCPFRPITWLPTAAQSREHGSVSAGDVKEPGLS